MEVISLKGTVKEGVTLETINAFCEEHDLEVEFPSYPNTEIKIVFGKVILGWEVPDGVLIE